MQACIHPSNVGQGFREMCAKRGLFTTSTRICLSSLSAYGKGYSCESEFLHLIEDWKDALDKNSVVGIVIMDLSKLSF